MKKYNKILSLVLSLSVLFQQAGFAQGASLNMGKYAAPASISSGQEKFRPEHLRYFSYELPSDTFELLLDKGDCAKDTVGGSLEDRTKTLLGYFLIAVALPDDSFWVNLRPDAGDNIIDPYLAQTDIGRIFLEADVRLKKDTAMATSPQTEEGKKYWDALYKKAEELYGSDKMTIPTLTRPWIVPDEVILREAKGNAYIYKAMLKVLLEEDYLLDAKSQGRGLIAKSQYSFNDPREKVLNEYSTQLIRELIIPKLNKMVNTSQAYAPLRQVYYSLILARWFKARFQGQKGVYPSLINSAKLVGLTSKEPWSKAAYFKQYQDSFKNGEYNIRSANGQNIRSYISGGLGFGRKHLSIGPGASSPVQGFSGGSPGVDKYNTPGMKRFSCSASPIDAGTDGIRFKDGLDTQSSISAASPVKTVLKMGADIWSRRYAKVRQKQKSMQKRLNDMIPQAHRKLDLSENSFIGGLPQEQVVEISQRVTKITAQGGYSQVVFISEHSTHLAKLFLQAITGTDEYNDVLKSQNKPRVYFVDSNDPVSSQRLVESGVLTAQDKVLFVSLGSSIDKGSISEFKKNNTAISFESEELGMDAPEMLSLFAAGIAQPEAVNEIYQGAREGFLRTKLLEGDEINKSKAYQIAAYQARCALTGQNISVLNHYGGRYQYFTFWLAQQFNYLFGGIDLAMWWSPSKATDNFHADGQGLSGSRGYDFHSQAKEQEEKGFISLIFVRISDSLHRGRVNVHGEVNPKILGFAIDRMLDIAAVAQKLALRLSDRPVAELSFKVDNYNDLGEMLTFGQVAAAMTAQLVKDGLELSVQEAPIEKKGEPKKAGLSLANQPGKVKVAQNVLNFKEIGPAGVIGDKIRRDLEGNNSASLKVLVDAMQKLFKPKGVLASIVSDLGSHDRLAHLDPELSVKDMDICAGFAERFKKYKKIYVAGIGGSVVARYLEAYLNLTAGPEIVYVTDYDENRLAMIEEEIRRNPRDKALMKFTKSGVTTETDANGGSLWDTLESSLRNDGASEVEAYEHFLEITDAQVGDDRPRVNAQGYWSINHPPHGGRFSIFSSLGMIFYFLKGGDRSELVQAFDEWSVQIKNFQKITKEASEKAKELDPKKSPADQIKVMAGLWEMIRPIPGIQEGFLKTFMNTIHRVYPGEDRDTEVVMTADANLAAMISVDSPFKQQLNVESLSKPGARYFAVLVCGLSAIRQVFPRIKANQRAFVTFVGTGTGEDEKQILEGLTDSGVAVINVTIAENDVSSLAEYMRATYLELAVSAGMLDMVKISSEGQDNVEFVKSIISMIFVSIDKVLRSKNPGADEDAIIRKRGKKAKLPKIRPEEIERAIEVDMDLEDAGMDRRIAEIATDILRSTDPNKPGLATWPMREEMEVETDQIETSIHQRILDLISAHSDVVSELRLDAESRQIGAAKDGLLVLATSLEDAANPHTNTANGTSIAFYRQNDDGVTYSLAVSIRVHWGTSIRVLVSNGQHTQDYSLRPDGRLVEISRRGESNKITMPDNGTYVSLGDFSGKWPESFKAFVQRVLGVQKFKERHSNVLTADLYTMFLNCGMLSESVTYADAFSIAHMVEAAGGLAMTITDRGLTNIKDIPITRELLLDNSTKIYVYAGVVNLVRQMQVWEDFLYARKFLMDDKASYTETEIRNTRVFDLLGFLSNNISPDSSLAVKSKAIMLLLRMRSGLSFLPKTQAFRHPIKELVDYARREVEQILKNLNYEEVIAEVRQAYIADDVSQRVENPDKYLILGDHAADMRHRVEPGEATKALYRLESMNAGLDSWEMLESLSGEMEHELFVDARSGSSSVTGIDRLRDFMDESGKVHKANSQPPIATKEPKIPWAPLGASLDEYLNNELGAPGSAGLSEPQSRRFLKVSQDLIDLAQQYFLNDICLDDLDLSDELQQEVLEGLQQDEPELFSVGKDGKAYIASLGKIIVTLYERKGGNEVNTSGDVSSRLDAIFNDVFKLGIRVKVNAIVSEEDTRIVYGISVEKQAADGWRPVLYLDPIDGSGNVALNNSFGSIFTLGYLKPGQNLEAGDLDPRTQLISGFKMLYGPTTFMIMVNLLNRVTEKPEIVQFRLSKDKSGKREFRKDRIYQSMLERELELPWEGLLPVADPKDPEAGVVFASGGCPAENVPQTGHNQFTGFLFERYGVLSVYGGALLNDVTNVFLAYLRAPTSRGGMYAYPMTAEGARLRTGFEGYFYVLFSQVLGGQITDGREPLANKRLVGESPSGIKTAFYVGSAWLNVLMMNWSYYIETHPELKENNYSDEEMQKGWDQFIAEYRLMAQGVITQVANYTGKSEAAVRRALLTYDSRDTKEDYLPVMLKTLDTPALAEKLFPESLAVSSPSTQEPGVLGGIDLRALPITIEPMGGFTQLKFDLPELVNLEAIDLNKELGDIQRVVKAGVIPSGQRIKEYIAACYHKHASKRQLEALIPTLVEVCRLQEENVVCADSGFKEALVLVDAG